MTDYKKYINALRKCAKEHKNDRTSTGQIVVSDLCRDTANLLEELSSSEILKNSTTETLISLEVYKQVAWERDIAIEQLHELGYEFGEKINKKEKTLEQETRWIPVNERLPKIADVYRVTRRYTNNVMNPEYLVDACFFDGFNTWYNDNRINHERAYADNIIAWQENPEPYKVEPQEDEEKLKDKVIIDAEITGSYVILKLNDGTIFEYEASDGGYSAWNWKESEDKE